MIFFNDSKNKEKEIRIKIENILFFKEALMKRISKLKIISESHKIPQGQKLEKYFSDKDINNMLIDELILNFDYFHKLLKDNQISFYNVNTFFNITKKIVEYYSARNDENHLFFLRLLSTRLPLSFRVGRSGT